MIIKKTTKNKEIYIDEVFKKTKDQLLDGEESESKGPTFQGNYQTILAKKHGSLQKIFSQQYIEQNKELQKQRRYSPPKTVKHSKTSEIGLTGGINKFVFDSRAKRFPQAID